MVLKAHNWTTGWGGDVGGGRDLTPSGRSVWNPVRPQDHGIENERVRQNAGFEGWVYDEPSLIWLQTPPPF